MGFDDDHDFSIKMQERHALDIYREAYGGCKIHQNDKKALNEDIARLLDFGDVDKIIEPANSGSNIFLAQRFRRNRDPYPTDFTLRCEREGTDEKIEYDRLMDGYNRDDSVYPKRYAFGVCADDPINNGFRHLSVIDTTRLIKKIISGELPEKGPKKNKDGDGEYDGTKFYIYPVHELKPQDLVVWDWRPDTGVTWYRSDVKKRPSKPHKITSWQKSTDD